MKHVKNIQYVYLLNKYTKCSIWRLAVRYDAFFKSLDFKGLRYYATNRKVAGSIPDVIGIFH